MRRWLSGLMLFIGICAYGQTFTIVRMEGLPTDLSASTHSRIDRNGKKCGLMKVQCVLDGVKFAGNIMGDVEQKNGEYWVYLTPGTKQLQISHPRLLPLDIDFISSLSGDIKSGNTYRLILSIPEALYNTVLNQATATPLPQASEPEINTVMSGTVVDKTDGDPLIGCMVRLKNSYQVMTLTDVDGNYTLKDLQPGATIEVSYIGYRLKEITFTGKIPPNYNIDLLPGHGREMKEFFYDPDDRADYFDLKGNKLPQRPSKKGVYIRVSDGKAERIKIN